MKINKTEYERHLESMVHFGNNWLMLKDNTAMN